MKTAKPQRSSETQHPHVAVLAALPGSTLDAWHRRPEEKAAAADAPLTTEECYRVIELAAQRQIVRRRITPEFNLRDWLDAEEEVKSH